MEKEYVEKEEGTKERVMNEERTTEEEGSRRKVDNREVKFSGTFERGKSRLMKYVNKTNNCKHNHRRHFYSINTTPQADEDNSGVRG